MEAIINSFIKRNNLFNIILLAILLLLFTLKVDAARHRIPQNNKVSDFELKRRNLSSSGKCKWIEEVSQEFCCTKVKIADCNAEEEWFIEDELEKIEENDTTSKDAK